MGEPVYIGQDKRDVKWLAETANFVQKKFQENGHEFILIPCADVDKITSEGLKKGKFQVGTCLTDCTNVVSFATAIAGAICSYSITSKDKGRGNSSVILAETILDMVKEVRDLDGKK